LATLIQSIPEKQIAPVLTFWRIWHAHNEITHDKPCPSIEGSRRFLVSYLDSLLLIKQFPAADIEKGKMVIDLDRGFNRAPREEVVKKDKPRWSKPPPGAAKLNVDGSFASTGAGVGMALRDHMGQVIFTACRSMNHCHDATEAELMAIEEGLMLAMQWTNLKILVETDCAVAVELINGKNPNISVYAFRVTAIRDLLQERESSLVKISRDCNSVSHELANMGRTLARTELWLNAFPRN
jgi:ribonuclease HI